MTTNYPTALDDNSSLYQVVDGVTPVIAGHHNNSKDALLAIEAKLGVYNSAVPTSIDYRVGHPTSGHSHNGASGQGARISASDLIGAQPQRHILSVGDNYQWGAIASQIFAPLYVPLTVQLESVEAAVMRGPSGGTTILDVHVGATSIWHASQGHRLVMGPTAGRMIATHGTPNTVTVASGALIGVDLDQVGTNSAFDRISITFVFRE